MKKGVVAAIVFVAGLSGVFGRDTECGFREDVIDVWALPTAVVLADADSEISLGIIWHTWEPIFCFSAEDDDIYMASVLHEDTNLNRLFLYATESLKNADSWMSPF